MKKTHPMPKFTLSPVESVQRGRNPAQQEERLAHARWRADNWILRRGPTAGPWAEQATVTCEAVLGFSKAANPPTSILIKAGSSVRQEHVCM